jgi:hypothetical protein
MNLKQENNYEKFKQDVDMWIEDTQYWINSYSMKASSYINHTSLLQDTKSYLEKTKNLHSQLTYLKDLSKMTIDEWNEWRKIK